MPVDLLGLPLQQLDPLPHHAPHRAGHSLQPGEAGQCGYVRVHLESVYENLKYQQCAMVSNT